MRSFIAKASAATMVLFAVGCSEQQPLGPTSDQIELQASVPGTAVFLPGESTAPFAVGPALATTTTCTFTVKNMTMKLDGDCTTDGSIVIPDGFTLDGKKHTITAVDPPAGTFAGAIVLNGGATANVKNLTVTASGLANACKSGADRLRGIMFDGASGKIEKNKVVGINKGASGCQEGNAIEIRNAPFDGTHPNTQLVEVAHNYIAAYQKTGIVANGDVDVKMEHNEIGASATQLNLAANSIQVGFGGIGGVNHNKIDGNQWFGWSPSSDFAASAILLFAADAGNVDHNKIKGNSDVGLFVVSDNATYEHNKIDDDGPDSGGYDVGIWDFGTGNVFNQNKVCGFDTPFAPDPLIGKKNKAC